MGDILAKIVTILLLIGSGILICVGFSRKKLDLSKLSMKQVLFMVCAFLAYFLILMLSVWKWDTAGGAIVIGGICSYSVAIPFYRWLIGALTFSRTNT